MNVPTGKGPGRPLVLHSGPVLPPRRCRDQSKSVFGAGRTPAASVDGRPRGLGWPMWRDPCGQAEARSGDKIDTRPGDHSDDATA